MNIFGNESKEDIENKWMEVCCDFYLKAKKKDICQVSSIVFITKGNFCEMSIESLNNLQINNDFYVYVYAINDHEMLGIWLFYKLQLR